MFGQLAKFMGALALGDVEGVAKVLSEAPEETPPAPRAEGDPPCGKADGQTRCMGHGVDGNCIMGELK